MVWGLIKEPFPTNEKRKPHYRAPLHPHGKYKILVKSCNLHTYEGVKRNNEGEAGRSEKKKGSLYTTAIK